MLTDVYPETLLTETVKTGIPEYNINLKMKNQNIISNRIPIVDHEKVIGAVSIFLDKTELTRLAEELTGANYMVDTLRAFNHEFKNKLHVILGFLQMGAPKQAENYIKETSMVSSLSVSEVTQSIKVPNLAALLIEKIIRASELNITLKLKPDSICTDKTLPFPVDVYLTILGNLIENAMEELNQLTSDIKEIEVGIYSWPSGSILCIDDTGRGIPNDIQAKVTEKGFSTKGENRSTGLWLVYNLVNRYDGSLEIDSEEGVGTSITVKLKKDEDLPCIKL